MTIGIWTGLSRIGWDLPRAATFSDLHGPLLISGVFGTLVGLERAVASGARWPFAAPALSSAASVLLLGATSPAAGAWAYVLAAIVTTAISLLAAYRQPAAFTLSLAAGAAAWLTGSTVWALGSPVSEVAAWWLAFLVLTIAGERLELSRLTPYRRASLPLFILATGAFLAGAVAGIASDLGADLAGAGLLLLAAWLARHDIAVRTVRGHGQPRFMAVCMLAGYVWLGIAGMLLLGFPPGTAVYGYDMVLHAVLLGFTLSMVFGHALIILPAVVRLRVPYLPLLYGPLAMLHASVVLRVGSDLLGAATGRRWSGLLTGLAVAGFATCIVASVASARRTSGDGATA